MLNLSQFTRFSWVKFGLEDLLCVKDLTFRNSVQTVFKRYHIWPRWACSLCCIRWYARRSVFKQKGVCQSKQMSVKTRCKTKPLLSLQFLVCNNCPIHPEQGYFSYFCTLQDLQRLTFPVFARPSEGLVWTVCPSAGCIRAATYCQLSDKVKRFFWNSLPK